MLIAAKFSPNASLVCFPVCCISSRVSCTGMGSGWASQEAGVPPRALRVSEPCQEGAPAQGRQPWNHHSPCTALLQSILLLHTANGPGLAPTLCVLLFGKIKHDRDATSP